MTLDRGLTVIEDPLEAMGIDVAFKLFVSTADPLLYVGVSVAVCPCVMVVGLRVREVATGIAGTSIASD